MGYNAITGFNISVAEIQKWKDGMKNGVKGEGGKLIGKISDIFVRVVQCGTPVFARGSSKMCLIRFQTRKRRDL